MDKMGALKVSQKCHLFSRYIDLDKWSVHILEQYTMYKHVDLY